MDVLIVSTNRNRCPMLVLPYGACMAAEAAEQAGHRVRLLDLMFERSPARALQSELRRFDPDVVGLSVRNIDNNDMENTEAFAAEAVALAHIVRRETNASLVLGGGAIGVMPEAFLRHTRADWAVLADGEAVFPELLGALSDGREPVGVPGIAWMEDGEFRKNPCAPRPLMDECPVPDFSRHLKLSPYIRGMASVPVQTKRGCAFKCIYCTYRKLEGQEYCLCPPEVVVEAMRTLAAQGLRDIEFVDNVFNSPYEHGLAICEGIAKADLRVRLQSLELNPLFVDDDFLSAMERAGFVGIGITAESISDTVLSRLRKGYTSHDVESAASAVRRHDLPCVWIFMLGGPGETSDTVRETLDFAESCIRPGDAAFFNIGIRIYPGTELESVAREQGSLALDSNEMLEPVFYLSPEVEYGWLRDELHERMCKNMNFINTASIGLRFLPKLNRLGYLLGVRPPLWKHTRLIRKGLRLFGLEA